ncbi:hypothetical protein [Pseudacidovorax sp. RU35E]|uniref:hypothetical protein n=1 Tax=Pseudacidovorax sp. RU35E TaxID=1907403 RepID=UPI0009572051|nr:hypothetical protein [Pseudacidovorax sp. RU35E]SIQ99536.1 hypothetical protein SAMN05880557_10768 [Pseudacidovorax sp. RU35E]
MHIKHLTPEVLRGLSAAAVPTPEQQDRLEVRLLTAFVTLSFINDLAGPITYIFRLAPSMLHKVAALEHGLPGAHAIGFAFIVSLLLIVPHAVALAFFPGSLAIRWPRKLATLAAVISAFTWGYLGVLSLPLQTSGALFWLYERQGIESVGLAFIYAISLNAQLLRAIYKAVNT